VAANVASVTASDDVATSQEDIRGSDAPTDPVITSGSLEPSFPSETELLFVSGSNKIMLTVQRLLMRAVFQEAFERIRADMVFKNVFPNIYETIEMITDSLMKVAESNDRATNIYNRLALNADYSNNMSRLVGLRISNTNVTNSLFSPAHAFLFSAGRSRIVAPRLYRPSSWPFGQACRSFISLTRSSRTTIIPFQG
jgi:hypothetical protein